MYTSGGKVFQTMGEAVAYANFIAKVSRLIIAVEKIKQGDFMSTEYSVIDNGIIEFYGDLDECVAYIMQNRHYSGSYQIKAVDSFYKGDL